jgi:hypothetical protein
MFILFLENWYILKSFIFWNIKSCGLLKVNPSIGGTYLLNFQERTGDGGRMFLRNVGWLSTNYMALYHNHRCENLWPYLVHIICASCISECCSCVKSLFLQSFSFFQKKVRVSWCATRTHKTVVPSLHFIKQNDIHYRSSFHTEVLIASKVNDTRD